MLLAKQDAIFVIQTNYMKELLIVLTICALVYIVGRLGLTCKILGHKYIEYLPFRAVDLYECLRCGKDRE